MIEVAKRCSVCSYLKTNFIAGKSGKVFNTCDDCRDKQKSNYHLMKNNLIDKYRQEKSGNQVCGTCKKDKPIAEFDFKLTGGVKKSCTLCLTKLRNKAIERKKAIDENNKEMKVIMTDSSIEILG